MDLIYLSDSDYIGIRSRSTPRAHLVRMSSDMGRNRLPCKESAVWQAESMAMAYKMEDMSFFYRYCYYPY